MKIIQLAKRSASQADLQFPHDSVKVVAVNRQRLRSAPPEIAQNQVMRRLIFSDHNGFTPGLDAKFDHALIIRFPERSFRYHHCGGTKVVDP